MQIQIAIQIHIQIHKYTMVCRICRILEISVESSQLTLNSFTTLDENNKTPYSLIRGSAPAAKL